MEHYAEIDVSLELSSVCVVDAQGKIVRETKVASEPEALVAFFASLGFAVKRIGLEAGPLSAWLHAGLKRAGFDTVIQFFYGRYLLIGKGILKKLLGIIDDLLKSIFDAVGGAGAISEIKARRRSCGNSAAAQSRCEPREPSSPL